MKQPTLTVAEYLRSLFAHQQFEGCRDSEVLHCYLDMGDGDAFAALMRRHGPMVLGLARRIVRDHQLAEDVFQATFMVLARKARSISGTESLPAWLHSVAFRLAVRAKKSRERRDERESHVAIAAPPNPLDELSARELLTILDEELHRLPEKYRLPLILCHLEGLTVEQAAKRLNLGAEAVKGRLHRGRARLRARLTRRGLGAGAALLGPLHWGQTAMAVPRALVQATLHAALTNEGGSAAALVLANGVTTMMLLAKLRTVCLAILLLSAASGGAGWAAIGLYGGRADHGSARPGKPVATQKPKAKPQEKPVDLYGDPLPEGAVMRLGTVHLRAAGAKLAVSPDGKTLVGVRNGKLVSFWDLATGKLLMTRELDCPPTGIFALSADGRLLANERVEVWDLQTGKVVSRWKSDAEGIVHTLNFSRDGKYLAAHTSAHVDAENFRTQVWNLTNGKLVFSKEVEDANEGSWARLGFTPDGKKLILTVPGIVHCWDIAKEVEIWTAKRIRRIESQLCFSPDGRTIVSTRPPLAVATGQPATDGNFPESPPSEVVQTLALPDGKTVLFSSNNGVIVWDTLTGKEIRLLKGAVDDVLLAHDGKTFITNNGALQRWDVASWTALYTDNFDHGHTQEITAFVFSADGKRLASCAQEGSVRLWDTTTAQPLKVWRRQRPDSRVTTFFGSPVGGATAIDMSADGRWIASAADGEIRLRDGVTGQESAAIQLTPLAPMEGFGQQVFLLRLSRDCKKVVGVYGPTWFSGPSASNPKHWLASWDLVSGAQMTRFPVGTVNTGPSCISPSSCISPDGQRALIHGRVVDVLTGNETFQMTRAKAWAYLSAVSRDCALTAAADFVEAENSPRADSVVFFESATGQAVNRFPLKAGNRLMAFHPSNRWIALADIAGVQVWDIASGTLVATRKLPAGIPTSTSIGCCASCLSFTPDGRQLATGHSDGTILLWNVDLPAPKQVRLTDKEVEALWSDLQDADAAKAWRAVWRMADAPEAVLPFLSKSVKPFPSASAAVTNLLIADLGSDLFAKREAANKQLKDLGLLAETALRQTLQANPSLELRRRIENLLKALEEIPQPLTAESLRDLRAVAVLARINSPAARQILDALARGADSARLTMAAKAALGL